MPSTPKPSAPSAKTGKPKKKVSWAPDSMLRQIRTFQAEEVTHSSGFRSPREMERSEGLAARRHELQPIVDWMEPPLIMIPQGIVNKLNAPNHSQERKIQLERERSALGATYFAASDIPPSPFEPSFQPFDETILPKPILLNMIDVRNVSHY
jgi:hypothetical protein